MKEINPELSNVFIDIDNTLTIDLGKTFMKNSIEMIQQLSRKVNLFIWSQGGIEYVKEIVEKAQIEGFICGMLPKPDLIIDDISFDKWAGSLLIKEEESWNKTNSLINHLEGNWIEDNFTLREMKNK